MSDPGSPSHRQTWDVIPWLVNGTASADARALAEEHLRSCADCRDEYAFQSRLHAGMAADVPREIDAHAPLQRLFARIDASAAEDATLDSYAHADAERPLLHREPRQRARRIEQPRRTPRVLTAAVIAQSVALVLLGALLLSRAPSPAAVAPYQTLSRAADHAAAASIRFVPSPTLTVGALQTMLADANLRIVESNQGGSIYALAIDSHAGDSETARRAAIADAVASLRAQRGVLLVEPIGAATDPVH
jgi:hypothetical protein